jgi:hypothetical protein
MGRHAAPGRSKGKATSSWRSEAGAHRTVWTCGENDLRAGTGRLAGWLLNAVVKVVTTYSAPGDRALLVEPAVGLRRSRGLGPYGGLLEAAWSVVRLGRGVRTYQVGEAGEGSGCALDDRFDVVIVAAEPEVLASVRPVRQLRTVFGMSTGSCCFRYQLTRLVCLVAWSITLTWRLRLCGRGCMPTCMCSVG